MSDQTGPGEPAREAEQRTGVEEATEQAHLPVVRRRRLSIPVIIAAAIMFLTMASYVANGLLLLLDLDVFGQGLGPESVAAGALTPEGERLVLAGAYLFFGAVALVVLVGFLLKRGWAWSAAMTWTAIILAVGLVAYFVGEPHYLSMFAGVVLLLVLNQAAVHREFRIGER
jgi:hypothetical protein